MDLFVFEFPPFFVLGLERKKRDGAASFVFLSAPLPASLRLFFILTRVLSLSIKKNTNQK